MRQNIIFMIASKAKTIGIAFLLLGVLYVVFLINSSMAANRDGVERFHASAPVNEEESAGSGSTTKASKASDASASTYKSRLYVIKIFSAMFGRKPTADELTKYSSFGTEKQILASVMADYDKLETSNTDADTLAATARNNKAAEQTSSKKKVQPQTEEYTTDAEEDSTTTTGKTQAEGYDKYESVHEAIGIGMDSNSGPRHVQQMDKRARMVSIIRNIETLLAELKANV